MNPWWREINRAQWKTLLAAHLGWLLDGFDVMLYAFALLTLKDEFQLSSSEAGSLASATLIASAFGGTLAGFLADRWGRKRVLIYSILLYSIFTGCTATAASVQALLLWRALVGIGLGAEWSAGSVLVAETWPDRHRAKAAGLMQSGWALGYIAAAILSSLVLPRWGWRILFALGVIPALITYWIRKSVPESPVWRKRMAGTGVSLSGLLAKLFSGERLKRLFLATALTTSLLFAYWGLFTWVPAFLSLPVSKGGAGLTITQSLGWIIPMQLGAFLGYVSFGFLADRLGRRVVFVGFVLASAVIVPVFGLSSRSPTVLILLSPLVGLFGHGYFSLFGAYLAELFDSEVRGTAQGLCYNLGRAASALAPMSIGYFADRHGLGVALSFTSAFYVLGAFLIFLLPETRGETLT